MKTEEADLLQTKLQQSSYHKQQEELDALKKIIGKLKTFCADLFLLLTFFRYLEDLIYFMYLFELITLNLLIVNIMCNNFLFVLFCWVAHGLFLLFSYIIHESSNSFLWVTCFTYIFFLVCFSYLCLSL